MNVERREKKRNQKNLNKQKAAVKVSCHQVIMEFVAVHRQFMPHTLETQTDEMSVAANVAASTLEMIRHTTAQMSKRNTAKSADNANDRIDRMSLHYSSYSW